MSMQQMLFLSVWLVDNDKHIDLLEFANYVGDFKYKELYWTYLNYTVSSIGEDHILEAIMYTLMSSDTVELAKPFYYKYRFNLYRKYQL